MALAIEQAAVEGVAAYLDTDRDRARRLLTIALAELENVGLR